MSIRQAAASDLEAVRHITITTISEIYPRYYPEGAVRYFAAHHSDENIMKDISQNKVFLCLDKAENPVGTVTINANEICRLFVLPHHQGNGYGRELLDFAEKFIENEHSEIVLAASLPAKGIYLKRGYKETEYNTILTDNKDRLCYDIMSKQCAAQVSGMRMISADITDQNVLRLFSEHDDFMIDFLGDDKWCYTRYSENENIENVWLVYAAREPIGCIAYRTKSDGVGEIKRLFIKNKYRGRGISKLLLDTVESHAKKLGCRTLFLDTRITLEPAVSIYKSFGFSVVFQQGLYIQMEKNI